MDRNVKLLLDDPKPSFDELVCVLRGEQEPQRVHLAELHIDGEVLIALCEGELGQPWVSRPAKEMWLPPTGGEPEGYWEQRVKLYYRLGYDYVPVGRVFTNHPPPKRRHGEDTAGMSRGTRLWVEEGSGIIQSWEDFEKFPWDEIEPETSPFAISSGYLPTGMKMVAYAFMFEHVMEYLLGMEGMFYLMADEPKLVEAVFERWGQKIYDFYAAVIGLDEVGAIFHADDLGFRTSSFISRQALYRLAFPWFKEYAALAHRHDKMFWYHSCGNHYKPGIMDDLIDYVGIDAFHSFQDNIMPVADFKARYGHRVATLGGVDMHILSVGDETTVRTYVRGILDACMPGGRFALSSGNSVTNYVPLENYFAMLDEARRWQG